MIKIIYFGLTSAMVSAIAAAAGMTPPSACPVITHPAYTGGKRPETPNRAPCEIKKTECQINVINLQ